MISLKTLKSTLIAAFCLTAVLLVSACNKESVKTEGTGYASNGKYSISIDLTEWNAPACGDLSAKVGVTSSTGDWEVSSSSDWLSSENTEGGFTLTAAENVEKEERSAVVYVSCGTDDPVTTSLTVTQDPRAYITLSSNSVIISSEGGSASVTVESNFKVGTTYSNAGGWIKVSVSGTTLTAEATENTGIKSRNCVVSLKAGDGAENVAEEEFTVSQSGEATDEMILEYTVSAGVTITLPLSGTVDCVVDWGDNSAEEDVSAAFPTHKYSSAGTYAVSIAGTVTALNSYDLYPVASYLTAVDAWGDTGLTDMTYAFEWSSGLKSIPSVTGTSLSGVTSFENAFYGCESLESVPADLFTNSSNLTSMRYAFFECYSLKSLPTGLLDGCTAVTDFFAAFEFCSSLLSIPSGLFSNCKAAENFHSVFERCSSLTEVPDGVFSGLSAAEDFEYAFYLCTSLKSIGSKVFEGCSSATNFQYLFAENPLIQSLPEDLFADCTELEILHYAFYKCTGLTTVPTGILDNCRKIKNVNSTFSGCTSWTGESPYTEVNGEKVHIYERSSHTSDFEAIGFPSYCFKDCTLLTDYNDIPALYGGGGD